MTDFLTRLAQRTLGLASVVQPRLASCYAPASEVMMENTPDQWVTPQPSTEAPDVLIPQIPSESSSQTVPYSNLETKNTLSIAPTEPFFLSSLNVPQNDLEHLSSPSQPTLSSPTNSSERLVKSTSLLPQQNLEIQAVSPTGERSEPQQLSPSSSFKETSSSPPPQSLKQPEQDPQVRSAHIPLVPLANAHSSSIPLVKGQETSIGQETGTGSPWVTLENRTQTEFAFTQSSLVHLPLSTTQPIKQPEPDIEVRIGRIEVRGIQPTMLKPHSKSTSSTPALSLSDYLNQRDGGKP